MLFLICLSAAVSATGQRLDGTIDVEGTVRGYSLYIPSGYDQARPSPLMLAMHPLNPARWNARSWCDTLVDFAEENGLILACPDGGAGGNVFDEEVDTILASRLLDSMEVWYNVAGHRIYVGGFSMGGAATYRYGLARTDRFAGLLPIGAAVNGTSGFSDVIDRAEGLPMAIVHGALDAPAARYTPVVAALEDAGAILRTDLLPGVGHTIDFTERNRILSEAFRWLDSVNLATRTNAVESRIQGSRSLRLAPQPIARGEIVEVATPGAMILSARLVDLLGREILTEIVSATIEPDVVLLRVPESLQTGIYVVVVESEGPGVRTEPIIVR